MKNILKYTFIAAAACLSLVSCEVKFELDSINSKPKIYLQAFPGNAISDTIVIQIAKTRPVNMPASTEKFNPEVRLSVNGEQLEIRKYSKDILDFDNAIPDGCLYAVRKLKPGDKIEISASAEGLPDIKSSSIIPDEFPDAKVTLSETEERGVKVKATFSDNPDSRDYYAVQLICEQLIYFDDEDGTDSVRFIRPISVEAKNNSAISSETALGNTIDVTFNGYVFGSYNYTLRCCNDDIFQGGQKTLTLDGRSFYDDTFLPTDKDREYRTYKLLLYKLSPEFYRFSNMIYKKGQGGLGQIGLAPSGMSYTNIEGGLGGFAGYTVREVPLKIDYYEKGEYVNTTYLLQ